MPELLLRHFFGRVVIPSAESARLATPKSNGPLAGRKHSGSSTIRIRKHRECELGMTNPSPLTERHPTVHSLITVDACPANRPPAPAVIPSDSLALRERARSAVGLVVRVAA